MAKIRPKKKKATLVSPFENYWGKKNYLIFGIGIGILIVGFYLMSIGPWDNPLSLSVSPIVLLIAYLVVFPLSILYKKKNSLDTSDVPSKN